MAVTVIILVPSINGTDFEYVPINSSFKTGSTFSLKLLVFTVIITSGFELIPSTLPLTSIFPELTVDPLAGDSIVRGAVSCIVIIVSSLNSLPVVSLACIIYVQSPKVEVFTGHLIALLL